MPVTRLLVLERTVQIYQLVFQSTVAVIVKTAAFSVRIVLSLATFRYHSTEFWYDLILSVGLHRLIFL